MATAKLPTTLIEAVRYFADENVCRDFLAAQRWPNGVRCVECDSDRIGFIPSRSIWYCKACGLRFSVKKGTIFEDSPLPLSKWLPAIWLYSAGKKSRSSHQLARDLGVTQKTAWFMGHRIRIALHIDTYDEPLSGEVEVDETFVGGKDKNKHADKREHRGRGPIGKVAVMGLLARHGEVRAKVVPSRKRRTLHAEIRANVAPGSTVYSDALASYLGLDDDYVHEVIDHSERYVEGRIHTNGIENFWSLFKRIVYGTHHSVEPFHLDRYLDEATYRFNSRGKTDMARFADATRRTSGRRLTYAELTASPAW
jgi:transposase-like protein